MRSQSAEPWILIRAVGDAVRICRSKLGCSQEELARRANLDRTYISQVERGVKNITIKTLYMISDELDVVPSSILRLAQALKEAKRLEKSPTVADANFDTTLIIPTVLFVEKRLNKNARVKLLFKESFQILETEDIEDAYLILSSGRIDCMLSSDEGTLSHLKERFPQILALGFYSTDESP